MTTLNELSPLVFGLGSGPRGYTPESDKGRKKLNELTELCTKLSEKVTSLEQDLKQTKQVYGKALTKLVKKVKHLEDQLKSTTKRRKAKVVISDEEEDLVSEDPCKQGRMSETEYEDVETEHAEEVEYGDILEQITPSKGPQGEEQSQESSEVHLESYTRRRSTDSSKKLNEEEMTKVVAREGSRKYWKIIRVTYKSFKDMLKGFDREDLVALWSLVKERFRSAESSAVHAKSFMVHHVFSTRGHCIYMLPKKDYPLTTAVMMLMLSRRLQVEEDSEMARDLV
ncbi:hypothetical protein Tco_0554523 [Tanacetum coccineum]